MEERQSLSSAEQARRAAEAEEALAAKRELLARLEAEIEPLQALVVRALLVWSAVGSRQCSCPGVLSVSARRVALLVFRFRRRPPSSRASALALHRGSHARCASLYPLGWALGRAAAGEAVDCGAEEMRAVDCGAEDA